MLHQIVLSYYTLKTLTFFGYKANFLKAVKDEKDSTIVENQWTKDGVENYGYGGGGRGETTKRNLKTKIIVKVFGELGLMILKNSFFKNLTQEKLKIYGLLILCQVKDQF